ncbi:unnamed protein product, partial [Adineta steineri]
GVSYRFEPELKLNASSEKMTVNLN